MTTPPQSKKTVLVTGANGYIGQAVARAFQRSGFATYGLVRSSRAGAVLQEHSVVPIIGSAAEPQAVVSAICIHTTTLNVIVSTTEDISNYVSHFNDTMVLLRMLAKVSNDQGVRPLVLFTSGCKDYGQGGLDGQPGLQPHTEASPLQPPPFLAARAKHAVKVLEEKSFDAAVLRPTHVHGYSSSYFGQFFELAAEAQRNEQPLRFRSNPGTILHSMHVDDCGEAYVALASLPIRNAVAGQCFNVSVGKRYETLRDVGEALVRIYDIRQGLIFDRADPNSLDMIVLLTTFSQWVDSEKLRSLTGWKESRASFAEGIEKYKREYELASKDQDENIAKIQARVMNSLVSR